MRTRLDPPGYSESVNDVAIRLEAQAFDEETVDEEADDYLWDKYEKQLRARSPQTS